MKTPDLETIGASFGLPGRFVDGSPYGSGHINDTYILRFCDGGGEVRYILQRVNQAVFKDVPAVMENVDRVTCHIRRGVGRARQCPIVHAGL